MVPSLRPWIRISQGDDVHAPGRAKVFQEIGRLQPQHPQILQPAPHRLFGDLGGPPQEPFHGHEILRGLPPGSGFHIHPIPRAQIQLHRSRPAKNLRPHVGREESLTGEPGIKTRPELGLSGAFCHRCEPPTCPRTGRAPWPPSRSAWIWRSYGCGRYRSVWLSGHPHRLRLGTSP